VEKGRGGNRGGEGGDRERGRRRREGKGFAGPM